MANKDRPTGFQPYGPVKQVLVGKAGSTCYPGDMVALADDGEVDPVAAGAKILGCALNYAAAGEEVKVSIDRTQLYVVQASANEIDAQTDIGNNADILANQGDAKYKVSRQELNSSTLGTSSAQLTILGIEKRPDNAFGANVDVIVKINESQLADGFAGI